jgi:hypothetical protein
MHPAGAVHENIERPCFGDGAGDSRRIGDIQFERRDRRGEARQILELGACPACGSNSGAFGCEGERDGSADALARAGYECPLALQTSGQYDSPRPARTAHASVPAPFRLPALGIFRYYW